MSKKPFTRQRGAVAGPLRAACLAMLLCGIMPGCKPTEKNYRSAYEVARQRRDVSRADEAVMAEGHRVTSYDGPRAALVDSIEVYTQAVRVRPESSDILPGRYCVAVGTFAMEANAEALASDLSGLETMAWVGRDARNRFWTIAAQAQTLSEAARKLEGFRDSHPGFTYVGLPGPVILDQ